MASKIISIDDSKAVHAYLKDCFANSNIVLEHAMNGKDGIEVLRTRAKEFMLIFLDWEMPEMTGPEVLKALQSLGTQIPVIMLTSKNTIQDITQMLELGAREYIMKPFTPDIIFEKVETVTGVKVEVNGTK